MLTFEGSCPHCNSDRGFVAFGMSLYCIGNYDYTGMSLTDRHILEQRKENNPLTVFSLAGTCLACHKPVVATCEASLKQQDELRNVLADKNKTCTSPIPKVLYPEPIPPYAHPSLPEDVRTAFVDLQKMLQQELRPHFIITGCRTVLEAAVKALGGEGSTLKKRIDNLHTQGKTTSVLHEWASHVRLCGNDATHEMTGSREEAQELVEFTKVFLQFTFELPARIAIVRAKNH